MQQSQRVINFMLDKTICAFLLRNHLKMAKNKNVKSLEDYKDL